MFYCDTSLLVSILVTEAHSAAARNWLGQQDFSALVISEWVSVEIVSALAKKQRMGDLSAVKRARIWAVWTDAFASRTVVADIEARDFRLAGTLVDSGRRGLRAADALHLAICERHGLALATLDRDLADAARAIGLVAPAIVAEA